MTETEQKSSKKAGGGEKCVFISKLAHIIPRPHVTVARAISKQTAMDRNTKIKLLYGAYNQGSLKIYG